MKDAGITGHKKKGQTTGIDCMDQLKNYHMLLAASTVFGLGTNKAFEVKGVCGRPTHVGKNVTQDGPCESAS